MPLGADVIETAVSSTPAYTTNKSSAWVVTETVFGLVVVVYDATLYDVTKVGAGMAIV